MSDPIRQQIIEAVVLKAAEIRTSKGYMTEMGKYINLLARHNQNIPFIAIWPGSEQSRREYGNNVMSMNLKVEGARLIGSGDRMELSEQILADIIENIIGDKWILDFSSGGTHVPTPGDIIIGAGSATTAILESISLSSGSWAGGDAVGTFTIRRKIGTFVSENLNIGGESNVATTDGSIVHRSAEYTTSNQLADDIQYISGGLEEYPEGWEEVVGMSANFIISYPIIIGNPYQQP